MVVTNFNDIKEDLNKFSEPEYNEIQFGDKTIRVLSYLPIDGKANLIKYIVNSAIDDNTATFSPVRTNVYYAIGILRSYCGIHFDDDINETEVYDMLERSGLIDRILDVIPKEEDAFMRKLIDETMDDIERFNNSFAGMMSAMSGEAQGLDESIQTILEKIKNKEGMDLLDEIKNVVGTD